MSQIGISCVNNLAAEGTVKTDFVEAVDGVRMGQMSKTIQLCGVAKLKNRHIHHTIWMPDFIEAHGGGHQEYESIDEVLEV